MNAEEPDGGCCSRGDQKTKEKCCPFSNGKMSMLLSIIAIVFSLMALLK